MSKYNLEDIAEWAICEKVLARYSKEAGEAEKIANNGFNFFKEFLDPENVEEYWFYLLRAYAKKIN